MPCSFEWCKNCLAEAKRAAADSRRSPWYPQSLLRWARTCQGSWHTRAGTEQPPLGLSSLGPPRAPGEGSQGRQPPRWRKQLLRGCTPVTLLGSPSNGIKSWGNHSVWKHSQAYVSSAPRDFGANSLTHLRICNDAPEKRMSPCNLPPHLFSYWQIPETPESINTNFLHLWIHHTEVAHTLILCPVPTDLQ